MNSSLVSFGLISDHFQLKPNIMNQFQFERNNHVNISMFERLICAPSNHSVPSTVLSTQRRMRTNICDLTRHFYSHLIEIQDHQICHSKKIKDVVRRSSQKSHGNLADCPGQGREVPGVQPHLFFWTHKGVAYLKSQRRLMFLVLSVPICLNCCCCRKTN